MTPYRVVVCTPSRGLIHSRTVEAALDALRADADGVTCVGWLVTHNVPIPACHETLAARGLATGADAVWFVEEDMVPPADALMRLVQRQRTTGAGIVTLDYPVGERPTHSAVWRQPDGTVLWCGLGCTLVTRAAFTHIPRPWFTTDSQWLVSRNPADGAWHLTRTETPGVSAYGGQDVAFCVAAREHGVSIAVADGATPCGHAKLRAWGAQHTNQGAHVIDVLHEIERQQ